MPKNPVAWLIIQLVVVAWLIYDLTAPGEAQSQAVVVLEYILLALGTLGLIGAVVKLASRTAR